MPSNAFQRYASYKSEKSTRLSISKKNKKELEKYKNQNGLKLLKRLILQYEAMNMRFR